ncbi:MULTISPECIES: DUF2461 domain-containing protein [Cellulophaga]|uniref:TIGR02453 family protein n=2 Tax=Cellulophaga TaxID=104264 RepID=F0RC96_CELLC|nr:MULTISPECIES: DUF2461 domain-containing protein [Cellulophaga]ADY30760.1 Conserved hypothetical protein CHP02453 [Cellulophaga lytica DSM 7489]AIM61740.1 hypothetical protein IX49_14835 [Cellulophaga lytica]APU11658.1 TIGR02453 family protein [Cellulophaga lytica]EWH14656.1 hypothetical protein KLA_02472 [Cellulophaga geojensis KL-A]MDO6852646.1 DUF2461 domain-containing protein [Cellulophaga lytica]
MKNDVISKNTFSFLNKLKENNTREWFLEHKEEFKIEENAFKGFITLLEEKLNEHDDIEKSKVFRIYRDVRFSKNKTPYKVHLAGSFTRAGARLRGGYYVHIEPGNSFIATGFWAPNKEDLFRIRKELELDASEFREAIGSKKFKAVWGELAGDELKRAPKGFDVEHNDIDLIRKKQYIFTKEFTDKEVLSSNFLDTVNQSFATIRPFFDLMSDVLTTNLNGESILD